MSKTLIIKKENIIWCNKFIKRLKGMIGSKYNKNKIYCFPKCNSIHTIFMNRKIDVIITDKNKNILKIYKNLKPWKIILPIKKGYFTYEFEINTIENINKIEKIRDI